MLRLSLLYPIHYVPGLPAHTSGSQSPSSMRRWFTPMAVRRSSSYGHTQIKQLLMWPYTDQAADHFFAESAPLDPTPAVASGGSWGSEGFQKSPPPSASRGGVTSAVSDRVGEGFVIRSLPDPSPPTAQNTRTARCHHERVHAHPYAA